MDVFKKMAGCSENPPYPIPGYSASHIIAYKNGLISPELRQKDEQAEKAGPKIHTPEFLESLASDIAVKYTSWIKGQPK